MPGTNVYGEGRIQVSYAQQTWQDDQALTGGSFSGNTITGLSGLTANKYIGEIMKVLTGTNAGDEFHVVSNGTTSIVCEESVASGFAATDRVTFSSRFTIPGTVAQHLGIVDDWDFPDPEQEYERVYEHGGGVQASRHQVMRTKYGPVEIPVLFRNGRFLKALFGKETCTANQFVGGGGSTTLDGATKEGATRLNVAAITNFTNGDIIEIDGGGSNPECRKINGAPAGTTIVVTPPLDHDHATAGTVKEVNTGANIVFTHVLSVPANGRLPYLCLEGVYDEATDFVRHALGCVADSWTLSAEEGSPLKASSSLAALDTQADAQAKASVTAETTEPFHPRMTQSGIVLNAVNYLQLKGWSLACTVSREERRIHNSTSGLKPFDHSAGNREHTLTATLWPSANTNIWNLLNNRTSFTATINLERTATSDEWTLTLSGCVIPKAGHGFKGGKAIEVEAEVWPTTISMSIADNIPYYPDGTAV